MSVPEGWYDDPSSPGRLRYWDGQDWTEWVNENDETRSEPLGPPPSPQHAQQQAPAASTPTATGEQIPVEPTVRPDPQPSPGPDPQPAVVQPAPAWGDAPAAAPAPASGPRAGTSPLARLGFALVGVAGLAALASIGQAATRAAGNIPPGYNTGAAPILVTIGLLIAAALGLAVAQAWGRIVGIIVAGLTTLVSALVLLAFRGGDIFPANSEIVVRSGWWILFVATTVATVGLLVAILGVAQDSKPSVRVVFYVVLVLFAALFISLLVVSLITTPASSWAPASN